MEGVETFPRYPQSLHHIQLRRLSPLWRGLRLDPNGVNNRVGDFSPKTIPVMEGVETQSA